VERIARVAATRSKFIDISIYNVYIVLQLLTVCPDGRISSILTNFGTLKHYGKWKTFRVRLPPPMGLSTTGGLPCGEAPRGP